MPFPNHPDKQSAEAIVTPQQKTAYKQSILDSDIARPPEAIILCYSRSLMDYLTETHEGQNIDHYYGDLYLFEESEYRVGVMGNFGIGAPTTAMLMDELIVDGVEVFLSVGFAGCLDEAINMGEFVVCEKAIRDEGTSHHYVESETYAYPSETLVAETKRLLEERDEPFHVGPTWTTDAIYRETIPEVEQYTDAGILTVEMEASAVFAVARFRDVQAGAMFVVSDYLGHSEWEPKFHLTSEDMQRLGETSKEILATHLM